MANEPRKKTLFAQVMDFVPRQTFGHIVERHQSNAAIEDLAFMLEIRREE